MPQTITNEDGSQYVLSDDSIAAIKTVRMSATHHASWSWNESALTYLPPSNPPDDGNPYIWDEARGAWVAFS
jgi:hypothetical protein